MENNKEELPEKWCVEFSKEAFSLLHIVMFGTHDTTSYVPSFKTYLYLGDDKIVVNNIIPEGYVEISLETLQKHYPTCKENLKVEEDNSDKPRISAEEFDGIITESMERCKNLLLVKGKEYIRNGDKFHNFRRAAKMRNQTMLQALQGMLDKHIVSWLDIIDDLSDPNLTETNITPEYVKEKLGDIDTYFHIAEPLIYERLLEIKEKGKQLIK